MRYAILSDIHGNWEALQAVIAECERMRIEMFLCAGDVVGYGANPRECIRLLGQIKASVVAGNHDWAVSGRLDASYFTEDGKAAVEWTRSQISFETIQALNHLPLIYKNKDLIVVHATLSFPEKFIYLDDYPKAEATFELMDRPVCFVGHTHVPQIYVQHNERMYLLSQQEVEINDSSKYIV
ncbi:MAG: metallophosphoesterase, partial [Candidatus Omnitrophica bacterium]|nr:metallophosphoesterase [Candidatus Omnitrophota bacterium]